MFLLLISILLFNYIAYKRNKIPTHRNLSIWSFTIAFQVTFDVFIEFKYHGYWYFDKGVDWIGVLPHTLLIPPINVLLLSWFPFNSHFFKKVIYITCWTIGVLIYEGLTLLPEPWGYFHLGWWELWYDSIVVPIQILILLGYYKLICKLENEAVK
ncbi:hypothetical protein ACFSFW_10800 [Fredinandcohnia salidurans]|uniref:Uncharacterized protein n=1 Tax=Fredinandcohnia salidurans TaxID=2595041 RepID=A0ABW4MM94_9BACI